MCVNDKLHGTFAAMGKVSSLSGDTLKEQVPSAFDKIKLTLQRSRYIVIIEPIDLYLSLAFGS